MSNFTPSFRLTCIALYFLLIPFTITAQFSKSGLKNLPANPPELDQVAVPWLPFLEDWSSGLFETNLWEMEQYGNWQIAGQTGNSAPSAEFLYSPPLTNYQKALTSRLLNARNLIDGGIYLSFDLRLMIVNPTGLEFMKLQVLTDSVWLTVWADSNITSYDWVNKKLNITNPVKGNAFRFRFLAEGQNSLDVLNWLIDNISVYRECAPPTNLNCSVNFPNLSEVILTWEEPEATQYSWLGWDNGINSDGVGLLDDGSFHAASRFTPAQLGQYAGTNLTMLRFFPLAEGSFVLKVWTGANAAQLVLEQPVDVVVGSWNEFELNAPVYVSGTTELWFGYRVTHISGLLPAGVDQGPAIAGFGDMVLLEGIDWESLALGFSLDFNWNLQGLLQTSDGAVKVLSSSQLAHKDVNNYRDTPINRNSHPGNRGLLRYDIYDCYNYPAVYVGTTTETSFIYEPENHPNGFCHVVSAVYADCEAYSNSCELYWPKSSENIKIYPVPADVSLTIETSEAIVSLIITDFYYRPVYHADKIREGTFTINTSDYQNGIYLIRAINATGNISTRKFIVNH